MLNIRISQDLLAAIIFILIGVAALVFGADLRAGTSADMGPGYLPRALGWTVISLGVITGLRTIWLHSPVVGQVKLRPIILILVAACAFGFLVESAGFVVASAIAIFISLFGNGRPSVPYALGMVVILPAALAIIFIVGLGLPIDLWWF